ncbi:UDP-2,3-diacylglucosamine diphosphatase [Arcobacter sp.]|uniref:UDP-2,3-diacylglucosamine diphosphatase n=1 Tax=Arcobacter sp. TaxID=1872629 RepID=UPI003D10A947
MPQNIKENAIFIADSHFNEKRNQLLIFLKKLKIKEIETEQLILMGDMFDFISGESKYFIKRNNKVITLLNELSKSIEIIYLEGNHDYNLKDLFPHIKVYKREAQPIFMTYKNQSVALSHGDIYVNDIFYEIYCKFIRNKIFLLFMNAIDFNNFISKKIYYGLLGKNICHKIKNFKEIVSKRVKHYDAKMIIEGHFHQGKEYTLDKKRYKNIQSLNCSNEYVVLIENEFIGKSL